MLRIGIDDTDSKKGGCTTYIAALLADALSEFSTVKRVKLARLNPNVPWKTRGNGSICLDVDTGDAKKAKKLTLELVKRNSVFEDDETNPGVVFYDGEPSEELHDFYRKALTGIVEMAEAEALAAKHGAELHKFKNGRGVIGALAAIGSEFDDATYEIIAYRTRENWGKARKVDEASVKAMDDATKPLTFNNYDPENERVLVTPRSPCPVLFGIRGESPEAVMRGYEMVTVLEPVERTQLFYTNQGTDAHLVRVGSISEVRPYSSVVLDGTVACKPKTIPGRHVICTLADGGGSIDFAAYEPTKGFREIVRQLIPGDRVKIYGGAKYPSNNSGELTVNLEKLEVIELSQEVEFVNPTCGVCGRRMESAGVGQGFRCRKCKTSEREKEAVKVGRLLKTGLYSVPLCAMRHLSKPPRRISAVDGVEQGGG